MAFPAVPGFRDKTLKNPISILSRWKIFDNLRRSILPVGLVLLIVFSWMYLVPSWLGLAVSAGSYLSPILTGIFQQIFRIPSGFPLYMHARSILGALGRQFFQAFFIFMMLPYEAFLNFDAIIRTFWRMKISHKKLLEWIPSGRAGRKDGSSWRLYFRMMIIVPVFTIILGLFFYHTGKALRPDELMILLLWFFSPLLAWLTSTPIVQRKKILSIKQKEFSGRICRKTWRFFETFVTAEDNWLPPDNFQEEPKEALRTEHRRQTSVLCSCRIWELTTLATSLQDN